MKNSHKQPTYFIGVSGHRKLFGSQVDFILKELDNLFLREKERHQELRAISALAEGADSLFAQAALKFNVPLCVVIPFSNYKDDFTNPESLKIYEHLLAKADEKKLMPYSVRSNEAYFAAGKWIVDHCDLLVAVWNGKPAAGKGGTGDIVEYAIQIGRPIWNFDPEARTAKFFQASELENDI